MLKARKSLNFLTPPFFEAPFGGNPLEFGDEIWRQKTRVLGLPDGEEIMTLAFFILTQYRRVTDRYGVESTPSLSGVHGNGKDWDPMDGSHGIPMGMGIRSVMGMEMGWEWE